MRSKVRQALSADVVSETLKNFRENKLSTVRPVREFFDYHRVSVPRDTNEAIQVCLVFD